MCNMLTEKFILDLEAIHHYIFDNGVKKTNESEITELYTKDEATSNFELTTRQLRETKSADDAAKCTLKYDMLKMFIDVLFSIDPSDVTYGEEMIINTLNNYGLIKKIEE